MNSYIANCEVGHFYNKTTEYKLKPENCNSYLRHSVFIIQ